MDVGELGKVVNILLVEDNPADVRLTREMLKDVKLVNALHVVEDGEEALNYLYRRGRHTQAERPDLILLDVNLPRKDGREVLAVIKQDEDLKRIPVVALTASDEGRDVLAKVELQANCYVKKPLDLAQLGKVVRSVETFCLSLVMRPPSSKPNARPIGDEVP